MWNRHVRMPQMKRDLVSPWRINRLSCKSDTVLLIFLTKRDDSVDLENWTCFFFSFKKYLNEVYK